MFENILSIGHINFFLVFIEGIISFFSPCVIPLIPIYMSYLAGNAKKEDLNGNITYERSKVLFHTLFFVLGISASFFILGLSFSALGRFFSDNKLVFSKIGGIIIIILGLIQIGFLNFNFLNRNFKININQNLNKMNPIVAFVMGFTFSFAWTPCVGPALSSVLILASSAKSAIAGNVLVLVYTIGFIIPFILLGIFTTQALQFIDRKKHIVKYTIKVGGVILIAMGIMTYTGWINSLTGYLNTNGNNQSISQKSDKNNAKEDKDEEKGSSKDDDVSDSNSEQAKPGELPAYDFTLLDQNGKEHKLSEYKGKVVFLNFWATWCPPCIEEMPHIEELYKEYNLNKDEVVILGVTGIRDQTEQEIKDFLDENNYTFPTVIDKTGEIFTNYNISSYPTTFMIDKDGKIYGYTVGALSKDIMKQIIKQTLEGKKL
ncbi:MAG: redoxin domain-containing protein [Clostridioides difficile]|nr:cytochrome c biogenesis protein/redoxin [Clostridioides sp.]MBS5787772.1 redoxin domain-containing protein [Clostridioides difficile]